jgi:tetratricopeptide (TPR) repeat protein
MLQKIKHLWEQDRFLCSLFLGGSFYGWFMSQGVPYWDDDYTSWFWKIKDHGLLYYVWEWISPISTQPQHWGFNERPLESLTYKLFYYLTGYEAWLYFIFRSFVYGGLGAMIYLWGLRLVPQSRAGKMAALLAAVFFLATPGPLAAHVLAQDYAPIAELIFLVLAYWIFAEIEKTPAEWTGFPKLSDPAQKKWVLKWLGISFVTYLSYKSKADLKIIPLILMGYALVVRKKQWALFAIPVTAMILLAVPWGPGIFTKLPPFVPGSRGPEVGWMWQPASLSRMFTYLWSPSSYDFFDSLKNSPVSLAGLIGPFMLIPMLVFLGWKMEAFDSVPWLTQATEKDRSRTFVLVWFLAMCLATSALPVIPHHHSIRYGILLMVPASIFLAWIFGLFAESLERLPRWTLYAALIALAVQASINLNRSINYRRDQGTMMVAIDRVYRHIDQNFPNSKLALLNDFRPFDYHPSASQAILSRTWLDRNEDLVRKFKPFETYVISWGPSFWDQLEFVELFPGCKNSTLFDLMFPCRKASGAYLMRFIGVDPLFMEGEGARSRGDLAAAAKFYDQYLAKYPKSMAGHFVMGLVSFNMRDWNRSQRENEILEEYFPNHLSVLYNRALALVELGQILPAADRLQLVVDHDPKNYSAYINLFEAYKKARLFNKAKKVLGKMKAAFPDRPDVQQLTVPQ